MCSKEHPVKKPFKESPDKDNSTKAGKIRLFSIALSSVTENLITKKARM